jgi:methionyl-tRNA formyltransferase
VKKIAFVIYRSWAYEIYNNILSLQHEMGSYTSSILISNKEREFSIAPESQDLCPFYIIDTSNQEALSTLLKEHSVDAVFFYGWSWIVKEPVLSDYTCLCLHPSPLPKYRGGSPIQHQIISGEKLSAVTVIRMSEGIDDGDIYSQIEMSLDGSLAEIFKRIVRIGTEITLQFLKEFDGGEALYFPQEGLDRFVPLKRRNMAQSKLDVQSLRRYSYEELHNFVRALDDPYPNAYLEFGNMRLFVKEVIWRDSISENGVVLRKEDRIPFANNKLYLKIADGYALISNYKVA